VGPWDLYENKLLNNSVRCQYEEFGLSASWNLKGTHIFLKVMLDARAFHAHLHMEWFYCSAGDCMNYVAVVELRKYVI